MNSSDREDEKPYKEKKMKDYEILYKIIEKVNDDMTFLLGEETFSFRIEASDEEEALLKAYEGTEGICIIGVVIGEENES